MAAVRHEATLDTIYFTVASDGRSPSRALFLLYNATFSWERFGNLAAFVHNAWSRTRKHTRSFIGHGITGAGGKLAGMGTRTCTTTTTFHSACGGTSDGICAGHGGFIGHREGCDLSLACAPLLQSFSCHSFGSLFPCQRPILYASVPRSAQAAGRRRCQQGTLIAGRQQGQELVQDRAGGERSPYHRGAGRFCEDFTVPTGVMPARHRASPTAAAGLSTRGISRATLSEHPGK